MPCSADRHVRTQKGWHDMIKLRVGAKYNWKGQQERLVYLGRNARGRGLWHQFALITEPARVWCEVLEEDLHMLEETPSTTEDSSAASTQEP